MNIKHAIHVMYVLDTVPEKLATEDRNFVLEVARKMDSDETLCFTSEDSERVTKIHEDLVARGNKPPL